MSDDLITTEVLFELGDMKNWVDGGTWAVRYCSNTFFNLERAIKVRVKLMIS
jgi:hypothetical protein